MGQISVSDNKNDPSIRVFNVYRQTLTKRVDVQDTAFKRIELYFIRSMVFLTVRNWFWLPCKVIVQDKLYSLDLRTKPKATYVRCPREKGRSSP